MNNGLESEKVALLEQVKNCHLQMEKIEAEKKELQKCLERLNIENSDLRAKHSEAQSLVNTSNLLEERFAEELRNLELSIDGAEKCKESCIQDLKSMEEETAALKSSRDFILFMNI